MMEPGAGSQTMCEHEKVNVTGAASSHRLALSLAAGILNSLVPL